MLCLTPPNAHRLQELPEPKPLDSDKYWTIGGWNRIDLSARIDPETVNPVQTIEACKPWEHLKMPITCTVCKEHRSVQPFLDQVHWLYQHCITCPNFFACGRCASTKLFQRLKRFQHTDHLFINVTTRPLSAPLYDGSDLCQLIKFKGATTSDHFFLFFPWFFHCFAGMEEVRNFNRDQMIALLEKSSNKDSSSKLALRQCQDFPVDWYLRTFGSGDWRALLRSLMPLVDRRIQIAVSSVQLHGLLLRLQDFVRNKETQYGSSDIPALPEAWPHRALAMSMSPATSNHLMYTIPLQFMTVLDSKIDQRQLKGLLSKSDGEDSSEDLSADSLVSEFNRVLPPSRRSDVLPAKVPRLGKGDGLPETFKEINRLWSMFDVIFQDVPGFEDLKSPEIVSDLSSYFDKMLLEIGTEDLQHLKSVQSFLWPTSHPERSLLERAQEQRLLGDYNQAIKTLNEIQQKRGADPAIVLELLQVLMDQGYIHKAMDCYEEILNLEKKMNYNSLPSFSYEGIEGLRVSQLEKDMYERTTIARALLNLKFGYLRCFARGRWEVALHDAGEVFERYLRTWRPSAENISLHVYLELYYHRIVLEASRDLGADLHQEPALSRLTAIRKFLSDLPSSTGLARLAFDVLLVELALRKRSVRAQYFDIEDCFSVSSYLHTASVALPLISTFSSSSLLQNADKCTLLVKASILLLEADIHLEAGESTQTQRLVTLAEQIYKNLNCEAGLLDIESFRIRLLGRSVSFDRLTSLYGRLRKRNDLHRLRQVRQYHIASTREGSPEYEWEMFQRISFRDLAKEAGDNIMYQRWNIRKYAGDSLAVASIDNAEKVIENSDEVKVHSNLLTTIASFNLSKAYASVGNFFEAALNAMLHLSLCAQQQSDVETRQRAILNVLHVFTEAVAARGKESEAKLAPFAHVWTGWLTSSSYERWRAGKSRCDEIDRFIDGACFLPNLAARVGAEDQTSTFPRPQNQQVVDTMIAHLQIAFGLCEALPTYLAHTVMPKLLLALAAVASYVSHKELAIRACWEGLRCIHSENVYSKAVLRLQAGKMMTLLGEDDPEHWLHVVPAGRSLLEAATWQFYSVRHLAGATMKLCEANVSLLQSFICEARARKLEIIKQAADTGLSLSDEESFEQIIKLARVSGKTKIPQHMIEVIISDIAQRLSIASPFEASRNLAFLASNQFTYRYRELTLELCLIIQELEPLQQLPKGWALWSFIQKYKATALYQRFYFLLIPRRILKDIEENPEALKLYQEERSLVTEGPQSIGDHRLEQLQQKMMDHLVLKPLLSRRKRTLAVSTENFQPLVAAMSSSIGDSANVVLIDWMRYHDYFLIVGYDASKKEMIISEIITDCPVADVEAWVADHLKVDPNQLQQKLASTDIFKSLYPLVHAIHKSCKKGDLLVLSPSQELYAVPLHALPYASKDDAPVIDYHPIVYIPSNLILKECVQRVSEKNLGGLLKASLLGRWGPGNSDAAEQEANISDSLKIISSDLESVGITSNITSCTAMTHDAFTTNVSKADILHFHAHVDDNGLKQHLILERSAAIENSPLDIEKEVYKRSISGGFNPFFNLRIAPRTDIYTLQDAFATQFSASLVVMLGCGSGKQSISPADDALGLVSAFFAAGATSIVAALWPFESNDASRFSAEFYREAFVTQKEKQLIDLAGAFQRSVKEMRACQREGCKRKSIERKLKCHATESQSPYHWAMLALWGSWVMPGVRSSEDH